MVDAPAPERRGLGRKIEYERIQAPHANPIWPVDNIAEHQPVIAEEIGLYRFPVIF